MVELNKWFFVHVINFLVLLALLNYILFRPLLCMFTRREDHIKGSLNTAKAMDQEKEAYLREIEARFAEAREKAKTIFEELSNEGLAVQKEYVKEAQREADEILNRAKRDLEEEVKRAKESLRGEVETFSKMIVEKMVGV
jgi:F-type H+-transporting ATPase subunit b